MKHLPCSVVNEHDQLQGIGCQKTNMYNGDSAKHILIQMDTIIICQ
jgi:hypothetical protein